MDGSEISIIERFDIASQIVEFEKPRVVFSGSLNPAEYLVNTEKSIVISFNYAFIHEKDPSRQDSNPPLVLVYLIDVETKLRRGIGLKRATVLVELATEDSGRECEPLREEKLFKGEALEEDKNGIFCITPSGEKLRLEHLDLAQGAARRIFKGFADNIADSADLTPPPPEDPQAYDESDNPKDPTKPHVAWNGKIAIISVDVTTKTVNGHKPAFSFEELITIEPDLPAKIISKRPLSGILADPKSLIEAHM